MTSSAWWTLDELVERVTAALAGAAYPGAPNGRVREVPDRRAIRWYTTIGLVDRPAGHRGRTALYGPRHLLQLVAVKRLQAEGRSLTEIQVRLTGATDATLRRIARVPTESLLKGAPTESLAKPAAEPRPRFWAQRPAPPDKAAPTDEPAPSGNPTLSDEPAHDDDTVTTTLTGVTLPGGAVLLLPARPDRADLAAIQAAAQPLLDLLADRGLLSSATGNAPVTGNGHRAGHDAPRRSV